MRSPTSIGRPFAVAAYITAAYRPTASTSFANPAVTTARSLTNTFAGIRPADVAPFIVAQLVGAAAATALMRWLVPTLPARAAHRRATHGKEGSFMSQVIFACVHNAGRSQMAAAFFNQLADPKKAKAASAGTEPGQQVHPEVLAAMKEVGIDLSRAKPQLLTTELAAAARYLITMGCGDKCPVMPGMKVLDWPLEDLRENQWSAYARSATTFASG